MSRNLLQEDVDDYDRERTYDDAPPRRFRFMLHHFRRRRIFVVLAVVLIVAIVIVAAVPKGDKKNPKPPPVDPNREPFTDVRLPSWVIPKNYKLHVNTNFNQSFFSGMVEITLQITNRTKNLIVIHAVDLGLDTNTITLRPKQTSASSQVSVSKVQAVNETGLDYHLLYFDSLPKLNATDNMFVLSISFRVNLSSTLLYGYYLSSYVSGSQATQLLATTQFEPTYARRAFPCFDEPELKATFDISMTVEEGYEAISNMPNTSYSKNATGTQEYIFDTSKNMSTYLVCYIVHKFAYKEMNLTENGNTTRIRIYTTPDTLDQVDYALNATHSALRALNAYFNISYPLPKLDVVAIPDFSAGAMENWGIVTFRVHYLLFDNVTGSAADRQGVADVIVHELAHQWFGNLVTMKWWSDIFLNEGFATFMEYNIVSELEPSWNFPAQFQIDVHQSAFRADSLMSTHPIANSFNLPDEIASAFDAITYEKGASVIKMLNSVYDFTYGDDAFRKIIQEYLLRFQYSNAAAADLWACFNSSKMDVVKLMNSWVNQAGFPYITVHNVDDTHVSFTQTRFLQVQPDNSSYADQLWWIYITAMDSKKVIHANWMLNTSSLQAAYDWKTNGYLLLNADGSGFYRTLYNVSQPYMDSLYTDLVNLNNVQRSVVYDDAFNFWQAGMIPSSQVLDLSSKLKSETDYVVWVTALSGLNVAYRKLRLVSCYEDYQNFVQGLLTEAVKYVGWSSPGTDEYHQQDLLRSAILQNAANYHHPAVIETAFQLWNNGTDLSPSVRNTVLRTVVANGNGTILNQVMDMYKKSTTSSVKISCLQALGYAPHADLQQAALDFALNTTYVRSQDAYIVFIYMTINPDGLDRVWVYFRDNIDLFAPQARLGDFKDDVIAAVASSMSGDTYFKDMEGFLKEQNMMDSQVAKQALESIKINGQWISKNAKDVCSWLNNKNNNNSPTTPPSK